MTQPVITGLLWFSAVGCGLIAGLYFAFSTFVMTALGRIDQVAHFGHEFDQRYHLEFAVHAALSRHQPFQPGARRYCSVPLGRTWHTGDVEWREAGFQVKNRWLPLA